MPIDGVIERYVCRRCHARIGRPYADPETGELDHDRMVCAGDDEHEICQEGDIVSAASIEMREVQSQYEKIEVLGNYGYKVEPIAPLYEEFEGFD